jgi:hypothetical protein
MKYVLFVCTHNAGRSQIAQALLERHAPPDVRAESPGQQPADGVWPEVVEAMGEIGIDLSARRPKKLTAEMQLQRRTPANARALRMELAGLEPATSWVRSKVIQRSSCACLQEIPCWRSVSQRCQFLRI